MRLPPLTALRAFEAAARHQSFLEAARELNVTPAAISHQIKGLEADLGVRLFDRLARGVSTTAAAREILPEITRGFAHFARGVAALSSGDLAGKLVVSAAPSFATLWLIPRLGRFLDRFPEVDVQVRALTRTPDVLKGEVDLRIPYGMGDYPGLVVRHLMADTIFPVAAPVLLNRRPIRTFAEIRHHTLLQDVEIDSAEPTMTWRRWLRDAGLRVEDPSGWVEFNNSILLTESAVRGHGVALGRMSLVREYLETGRLVRPLKVERPSDYAYYSVTSESGAERPRVRAFIGWLEEEAARDRGEMP